MCTVHNTECVGQITHAAPSLTETADAPCSNFQSGADSCARLAQAAGLAAQGAQIALQPRDTRAQQPLGVLGALQHRTVCALGLGQLHAVRAVARRQRRLRAARRCCRLLRRAA